MTTLALAVQVLLAVPMDGRPVRFGVPLPAAAVAQGLRLRGPGQLQWRPLPAAAPPDRVWVEVAIAGAVGEARVVAGGGPACADGRGPAFVLARSARAVEHGRESTTRWLWNDGSVDEVVRVEFHAPVMLDGEPWAIGEARTRWNDSGACRGHAVCDLPRRLWEAGSVLPAAGRIGEVVRRQLALAQERLVEMPGARGAGDFLRSGAVVTNLEFDTTLGLLQQALAGHDRTAFARALRCATHLRDRDLDQRTGLPFAHGPDHRTGVPVPGHAWLRGLLLAGLLATDDGLIAAAGSIARALASSPPLGEGHNELARDYAWPLEELEAWLACSPDPVVAAAANRLAIAIDRRFDPQCRVFRFGEGEIGDGSYLERGWITGGIVLPALQLHLARRPDPALQEHVRQVQQALLDQIGAGRPGLPTHWRTAGGRTFAEHRAQGDPRGLLLLEGLDPRDLRRLARRESFRDCIAEVPRLDDVDLPTTWSMVARCRWVWR